MPAAHIEELDQEECRRLLATRHLGRLAIPDFGGPVIFAVNYILDQDLVIFRTDPGSKLDAATEREQVAFEVDAVEEATRTGWSVVVRREDPLCAGAAAQGQRPPHQDPRRAALHLVGLTGRPVGHAPATRRSWARVDSP